jgi:hypothetical protein
MASMCGVPTILCTTSYESVCQWPTIQNAYPRRDKPTLTKPGYRFVDEVYLQKDTTLDGWRSYKKLNCGLLMWLQSR